MGTPSNSKPPKEESGNFTTTRVLSYGFLFYPDAGMEVRICDGCIEIKMK